MMRVNRIVPQLEAEHYKTYALDQPLATHYRPATCAEVECPNYAHGWLTMVIAGSEDEGLVRRSGRHFSAVEQQEGGFLRFTFTPGQPCFGASRHVVPLEREPIYRVLGGDWRGNPRGITAVTHARAEDWVDDFATHQEHVAEVLERG